MDTANIDKWAGWSLAGEGYALYCLAGALLPHVYRSSDPTLWCVVPCTGTIATRVRRTISTPYQAVGQDEEEAALEAVRMQVLKKRRRLGGV